MASKADSVSSMTSCIMDFSSLSGYMLEVDPDKRPDIFQAAYLAFRLTGRECPIPNLTVSSDITVKSLV